MALRKGIAFCPEDRKKEGIIGIRSVLENINISSARILSPFGILNMVREVKNAQGFVDKLSIKTPTLSQRAENLSGGNQQKVILARLLSEHVKVLLFDEPTRGIDVGAKSEVYSIIMDLAARGFGILLVSSDLPEILGISDRILVMREGSITASLSRAEATEEGIMKRALPSSDTGDRPTACADPDRN
jgi:L-arabinose transport system ATP-binding protein